MSILLEPRIEDYDSYEEYELAVSEYKTELERYEAQLADEYIDRQRGI